MGQCYLPSLPRYGVIWMRLQIETIRIRWQGYVCWFMSHFTCLRENFISKSWTYVPIEHARSAETSPARPTGLRLYPVPQHHRGNPLCLHIRSCPNCRVSKFHDLKRALNMISFLLVINKQWDDHRKHQRKDQKWPRGDHRQKFRTCDFYSM